MSVLGEIDACEAVFRVGGKGNEGRGFGCWYGAVHLVLAAEVGPESQPEALLGVLDEGVDVGGGDGEWCQVD